MINELKHNRKRLCIKYEGNMRRRRKCLFAFGIYRVIFYVFTTFKTYSQIPGRSFRFIDFEIL
jgi:hypothetical protein